MRIVRLNAENIKKLVAVEITPTGDIVTISGANEQGKSSILDSVWWALSGGNAIQAQPIRKGQNKAKIRLDMGELVIERKFTPSGNTLTVESADGSRFPSPQKMLDALLGELSFDPLAFARMKPREQFDELRRVVPLDVDVEKLTGLNRSDFEKRTDINRQAKAKRAQAEGMPVPAVVPANDVDETTILDKMEQAAEKNNLIQQKMRRRQDQQASGDAANARGLELRNRAAKLREEAALCDSQATTAIESAAAIQKTLDESAPIPALVDVTELRAQLDSAKAANKDRELLKRRQVVEAEAAELERHSTELTEAMDARVQTKNDAIAKAAMPVVGLGFGDGIVLFNEVPFEQASSAQQLKVSLAIAMAANPKVRVIRIQDGSLLDENSMAAIAEMARESDYQVWVEVVDTSGKLGIVIEDGAVVAVNE